MNKKENKVKFNIKNVHYAVLTEETEETFTYATPVHIPGAVSISLDAEGEISKFHADGIAYYVTSTNNGYSGDLEMAYIPVSFRKDVLNEEEDGKKVLLEDAKRKTNPFALLFEFDGDQKEIRRCLYNCTATRPSIESETVEETIEPGTESLSLTAAPRGDGLVKAQTGPDTDEETFNNWYKKVYERTEPPQVMAADVKKEEAVTPKKSIRKKETLAEEEQK